MSDEQVVITSMCVIVACQLVSTWTLYLWISRLSSSVREVNRLGLKSDKLAEKVMREVVELSRRVEEIE